MKWLTASCLAAMAWCAFCVAGLQMDLSYTEDWYYDLSDDQQRAVYSGILKRIAIIVGPLVATNVAVVLMVVAALRRATRLTSRR